MGAAETPIQAKPAKTEPKKSMRERVDGKIKSLDGGDIAVQVDNRDPHRWYVWANERPVAANTAGDVAYYSNLAPAMGLEEVDGFVVEHISRDPTAVKVPGALSQEEGTPILNVYGNTLMSCPIEFKKLIDSIGTNGQSGQEGADKIEKRMINRRGIPDELRGIGREGLFDVEAERGHYTTQTFSRMERG
jgi:hypothetical protein